MTPRLATSLFFFFNGFLLANWLARIPAITGNLGLSSAQTGTALLGMAIGALLAFPLTGRLIARFGSGRATTGFAVIYALALPLLAFAPNLPLLFLSLLLFGFGNGGMDVAMNAQGAEVEHRLRAPIMSSLHGFFSLGGLAGAGSGAVVAAADVAPAAHFLTVLALALAAAWYLQRWLLPDAARPGEALPPVFALPPRALWGLGLVACCAAVAEGAISDWSALYLKDSLQTDAGFAALGYAAFSATMLLGRFRGDRLVKQHGAVVLVRAGGLLSSGGLLFALAFSSPLLALLGFALVGAGLSVIMPLVYGSAASRPGIPQGAGVAAVATIGYSGFLLGPPVLGGVAQLTSLRLALGLVVLLTVTIVLLARSSMFLPPARRRK